MDKSMPLKSPFLEKVRQVMRVRHYSIRTERTYIQWIYRFILFHGKAHPDDLNEHSVVAFLTHLAVNRNVAPATQNQALNALVFLYAQVLERPLQPLNGIVRSKKQPKIPVVLTRAETIIYWGQVHIKIFQWEASQNSHARSYHQRPEMALSSYFLPKTLLSISQCVFRRDLKSLF